MPNRKENVAFTLTAGNEDEPCQAMVYTLDGEDPATCEHVMTYSDKVTLTPPDQDTEGTIVIKAMSVAPTEGGYSNSLVATVTVKYDSKSLD